MLAKLYAELLVRVLRGQTGRDADTRIRHFLTLLRNRGHEKLLPRIVREVERSLEREGRRSSVTLKVARDADAGKYKTAAKSVLKELGKEGATVREEVDEKLIRGYSLEGNDFTYDASARRKLIALFETLTA